MNFKDIFNSFKRTVVEKSPEILVGLGIAGGITAAVMAVRVTPKVHDIHEDIKKKHKDDSSRKEYAKEVCTHVLPIYTPSLVVGGAAIACIVSGTSISLKRNTAMAAAYSVLETSFKDYQDKVVETVGEKKEQEIRDSISKDYGRRNTVEVVAVDGKTLFYDPYSNRKFLSTPQEVRSAIIEIDHRMNSEMFMSYNDIFEEWGLSCISDPKYDLGYNLDDGHIYDRMRLVADKDDNEQPYLVIQFGSIPKPRYGYGDRGWRE